MAKYVEHWKNGVMVGIAEPPTGWIPIDPRNMAYADYLAWKKAGGNPDVVEDDDPLAAKPPDPPPAVLDAKDLTDAARQLNELLKVLRDKGFIS